MIKLIAAAPEPSPLGTIEGFGGYIPKEAQGGTIAAVNQIDIIFSTIITFLTIVGGLAFLIYFIVGAISWITAGGDAKKVDTAKSFMTNGAIGLIIIVAAYSIVGIVGQVLGLDILNPGQTINELFGGD